jgi:hypothetical protein
MPFDGPDDMSIVQSIRRVRHSLYSLSLSLLLSLSLSRADSFRFQAYPLIPTALSDPLRKLLRAMLSPHPALRPTLRHLLVHPWTVDRAAGECLRRSTDTARFEVRKLASERRSSAMLDSPSGSPTGSQAGVAVAQPCAAATTTTRLIESPAMARISYMELSPVK